MERTTRRNHFSSAALSITDDFLYRSELARSAKPGCYRIAILPTASPQSIDIRCTRSNAASYSPTGSSQRKVSGRKCSAIQRKFGQLYESFEMTFASSSPLSRVRPSSRRARWERRSIRAVRQDQRIIRRDAWLLGCGLVDTPPSATLNLLAR